MAEDQLASLDEQSQVPESRLSDPRAVRDYAKNVIKDGDRRDKVHSLAKGLFDGNPPWNPSSLAREGQKYRSNFNDGKGTAFLDIALTAYYDLFSEVPQYATVEWEDQDIAQLVGAEFDRVQRAEIGLDADMQLSQHEMVTFGIGPMIWDNDQDWRANAKKERDLFFPKGTRSKHEQWNAMILRQDYDAAELYSFIRNKEQATEMGWNVDAVKRALIRARDRMSQATDSWSLVQQQLRDNDLSYAYRTPRVTVGRVFYREFPDSKNPLGAVTERWIDLNYEDEDFLFSRLKRYHGFDSVIVPFLLDMGDGSIHSIKGLGVRMYSKLLTMLRLENALADSTFVQAALHVRSLTTGHKKPAALVQLGPFRVWPPDFEPFNFNATAGIEAVMAVNREFDASLSSNLALFRPGNVRPKGNPRTATENILDAQQQSILTKTRVARYFAQLDDYYREKFRRLGNASDAAARGFKSRLRERGVDIRALGEMRVTATRTIGQGSAFLRQQATNELLATVAGSLPEAGRVNLIKDHIAAKAGYSFVARYNPQVPDGNSIAQQRREALAENADLRQGAPVVRVPTDNDAVHVETHLGAAAEALQSVGQGADAMEVVGFTQAVLGHVEQDHFPFLEGDQVRASDAAQWKRIFDEVAEQTQALASQAQERVMAEQQMRDTQRFADPAGMARLAEVQSKIQLNEAKVDQQMRQRQATHEQKMRQSEELAQSQRNGGSRLG